MTREERRKGEKRREKPAEERRQPRESVADGHEWVRKWPKIHAEMWDFTADDQEGFEVSGGSEPEGVAEIFTHKGPDFGAGCQIGTESRCQSGERIK